MLNLRVDGDHLFGTLGSGQRAVRHGRQRRHQPAGRHGAGHAHLALAADLGSGDGGVLLVKNANRRGGQEKTQQAGSPLALGQLRARMAEKVEGDRRNHASRAIGGSGDDPPTGGVLFVNGHGRQRDRVQWRERVALFALCVHLRESPCQACRTAAHVQAARQRALRRDAALDGGRHHLPERQDALLYIAVRIDDSGRVTRLRADDAGFGEQSDFVGTYQFRDGKAVGGCNRKQVA